MTLGTYVATYFWRINTEQLSTLAAAGIVGMILGVVTAKLSRRFGKKHVSMILYGIAMIGICVPVLLGLLGLIERDLDALMPWLIAKNIIMTTCAVGAVILSGSMVADVAEHFELKTGERMEGMMFSALVMILKAVSGMGVFLSGIILSMIGFPEKADPAAVPVELTDQLAWIYLGSVSLFVSLAIAALGLYPITRKSHEETVGVLTARRHSLGVNSQSEARSCLCVAAGRSRLATSHQRCVSVGRHARASQKRRMACSSPASVKCACGASSAPSLPRTHLTTVAPCRLPGLRGHASSAPLRQEEPSGVGFSTCSPITQQVRVVVPARRLLDLDDSFQPPFEVRP